MKKISLLFLLWLTGFNYCDAQHALDSLLPVRGICMAAPEPDGVDKFIGFVNDALVPRKLNTIVLRIDYRYQYKSRPELISDNALSESDVKKNCESL